MTDTIEPMAEQIDQQQLAQDLVGGRRGPAAAGIAAVLLECGGG